MVGLFVGLVIGFWIGVLICFNAVMKLEDEYNHKIKTILERDEKKNGNRKKDVVADRDDN